MLSIQVFKPDLRFVKKRVRTVAYEIIRKLFKNVIYDLVYILQMKLDTHLRGRFISDSTFEEIFKPHYQRIIDAVRNDGMKFKTHCCGKEELMLDQFMSMGVRTFDPVQPCNDIQAMKKKGKIGIMGGLDIQGTVDIEGVTEEQLRAEIRRCIDSYAEGGAYTIYGASVHMYNPAQFAPNGVIGILMDETEKYGKGYYLKQVS